MVQMEGIAEETSLPELKLIFNDWILSMANKSKL